MRSAAPHRDRAGLLACAGAYLLLASACASRRAEPAAPPAPIPCGPEKSCDARREYCETIQTDVPALPSTYTCKPLPSACAPSASPAGCECFPRHTRCGFCRVLTPAPKLLGFNRVCVGGA